MRDSARLSCEFDGVTVLAGEAEGNTTAQLLGARDGWMRVLAVDAGIAIGPTESTPLTLKIYRFPRSASRRGCSRRSGVPHTR